MMRYSFVAATALVLFTGFTACKKSDKTDDSKTVTNISGTYNLTGFTVDLGGINLNVYDSLPACERDNVILLNADSSAQFVDAGTICDPPSDAVSTWHLSADADSIYLGDNGGLIKTFDGKNLVIATDRFDSYEGNIQVTLVKH
jgi:hypothetical protein